MILVQEFAILASSTLIAPLPATVRVCMHLTASSQTISLRTPYPFIIRLVSEQTPRRFVTCDSRISRHIWRLL